MTGCEQLAKQRLEAGRVMIGYVVGVLRWKRKTKFDPMSKFTRVNGEVEVKQL